MRLKLLDVDAVLVLAGEQTVCGTLAKEQGIAMIELTQKEHRDLLFSMSAPKIQSKIRLDDAPMDHVAVIFQTSGTSAEPKFVPCTHAGLLAAAKQAASWFCLDTKDRYAAPEIVSRVMNDPSAYVRTGGAAGMANMSPDNPVWVRFAQAMVPFASVTAKRTAAYIARRAMNPRSILDVAAGHGLYGIEAAAAVQKRW